MVLFGTVGIIQIMCLMLGLVATALRSLEFMDGAVRLRQLLNVAVLNQTGVKKHKLLVVLLGNPFVDAMESKKQKEKLVMLQKRLVFLYLNPHMQFFLVLYPKLFLLYLFRVCTR